MQFIIGQPDLSQEILLARDAFQRGQGTREFREEMEARAALPNGDSIIIPLAVRGDENDHFDNPEFVALALKVLDPAAAEKFLAFLDQRPPNPFPREVPMLLEELTREWLRYQEMGRGAAGEEAPEAEDEGGVSR